MNKKRYVVYAAVFLVLAVLVYLQFRTWQHFDWARLFQYGLNWGDILAGVVYIYIAYILRAVRWKIFLRPVRKQASILELVPPTMIGFTGLALLGRAGELIRPYLIARREKPRKTAETQRSPRQFESPGVRTGNLVLHCVNDPMTQ